MELFVFAVFYVLVFRWINRQDRRRTALSRLGCLPNHVHGPYRRGDR